MVLQRQKGNCFEYSIILCSYLIGSGYDAYVVSGYATREICFNDLSRIACPELKSEVTVEEVEEKVTHEKYHIKEYEPLKSLFLMKMEEKERHKLEMEKQAVLLEKQKGIEEFERPAPDPLHNVRIHSWVIILPGNREVSQPFFIEPATGVRYETSSPNYIGIESLWNHTNYWVNKQNSTENCKHLEFDLMNTDHWEHLLVGEPWHSRQSEEDVNVDLDDLTLQEKHLDMPTSWVKRLDIPKEIYERRYPNGCKIIYYKKAKVELFAPYVQNDGLKKRVTTFVDYEWQNTELVFEYYYTNRSDCLEYVEKNMQANSALEKFRRGREDSLKEHSYLLRRPAVEHERTMHFYHMARLDCLKKIEMHPTYIKEYYNEREDFLFYLHAEFIAKTKFADQGVRRTVGKLTKLYGRNPLKQANEDIAEQTFLLTENKITLKYHFTEDSVSTNTVEFIKPIVTGERLAFNPNLTYTYQVDRYAKPTKQIDLFNLLKEQLKEEDLALTHIRTREDEIDGILKKRSLEHTTPKLIVSIFDQLRNEEAKHAMKEKEEQQKKQAERQVEMEVDFLEPYLAMLGEPEVLSKEQALNIREACMSDYKQLLVDRANYIQSLFDKESKEIQDKHDWYLHNQDSITRSDEEDYAELVKKSTFLLHVYSIRLARHKDLSASRYSALEQWLNADERLKKAISDA